MKKILLYLCMIFISTYSYGQQIAVVKSEKIQSGILKQERELLIYLPAGYDENTLTHYDVIYVFDSQNRMLFDYVHAILGFLDTGGKEFIVVGITSPYFEELDYARNNDMLPYPKYTEPSEFFNGYSGNADNFLEFVEKEVVGFVEENYRTLGNRIAIGHSLSASLVVFSVLQKPNLFNDLIAVSPNFSYDNERLIEDILDFDFSAVRPKGFLYTSLANEGIDYWESYRPAYYKVQKFVSDSLKGVFEYSHKEFSDKTHWSTYPISIQEAFNEYFKYYSEFQVKKLLDEKIEITIQVSVPNLNDTVYITGNQEALANWNPGKIQLKKISDYERKIKMKLQLPAELKFTRGDWNSEALVKGNSYFGNIAIVPGDKKVYAFEIENWNDKIE